MKTNVYLFAVMLFAVTPLSLADESPQRQISVTGTTVTNTVPDLIKWHIYISDENPDLVIAKTGSDLKMKKILALREALNVKPEDMQTGHLNIRKVYNHDRNGNRTDFRHYEVSRSVTLRQRDVKRFDEFLAQLITAAEMDVSCMRPVNYRFIVGLWRSVLVGGGRRFASGGRDGF